MIPEAGPPRLVRSLWSGPESMGPTIGQLAWD